MTKPAKPTQYLEIASRLRDRIASGDLKPGDDLPSGNELAEEFGVARNTAARALDLLRAEGLIASSQGARSVVRDQPQMLHLATGENFRERQATGKANDVAEAEAQGLGGKPDLLSVESVPAPPEVAERFGIKPGTPVLVRVQLLRARRKGADTEVALFEPMKVMRCYYEHAFADGTRLAEPRLISGGLANLIEAQDGPFRRAIGKFVEDVEVRVPAPDEADQLLIPPGVPIARILRTMYDVDGKPLEVIDSVLPGDRYRLRYVIAVPEKP